jgi:acetyl esterase/lipase
MHAVIALIPKLDWQKRRPVRKFRGIVTSTGIALPVVAMFAAARAQTAVRLPYDEPINGDSEDFSRTILTSGTRDLLLSNTVRTHRNLRRAGVIAELSGYDGQSHAQYQLNVNAPETKEAFMDIARCFDRDLAE